MNSSEERLSTPVLFIPYDRPGIAREVFNRIREVKPKTFYFYMDAPSGARNNFSEVEENKKLLEEIDWDCEVQKRIRTENVGAARAVAEAITWVFEKEDRAIIIEEDLLPSRAFFYFCQELLEKYKNDPRILSVTGSNLNEGISQNSDSYFFSKYATIWGFATWKRVWDNYDFHMKDWTKFESEKLSFDDVPEEESRYAFKFYKSFYNRKNYHTWDAQLGFYSWSNRCLGIVPSRNLVSNIGHVGVHSAKKMWYHSLPRDEQFRIQKHPDFMVANVRFDRWYFREFRKKNHILEFIQRVARFFLRRKERFTKFILSGSVATIINLVSLNVLVHDLGFDTRLLENVANFLGMEVGILCNFVLSRNWVWKASVKHDKTKLLQQILGFHLVVGGSIVLRVALFPILQYLGIHYLFNATIGIALGAVMNFVLYDKLIFANKMVRYE